MNCANHRWRTKKYKKYSYCTLWRRETRTDECVHCENKVYRTIKNTLKKNNIKGKKHTRTKKTDIPASVKENVWHRDGGKCIFCEKDVPINCANAHFIPRSAGGLGIEKNIFTACVECHHEQDNGKNTKEYDLKAEKHLKNKYSDWNIEELIYKKH